MQLGDSTADVRSERSPLDAALDDALSKMLGLLEVGGLQRLTAAEKINFWQRFENFRNRLPLIDHQLIVNAEVTDLAGEYCFSSLAMLLSRSLQLSPIEAAARVRAAAALGPRFSPLGDAVEPALPSLAAAHAPVR